MIKPYDLIKQINLDYDLRFYTEEEFGKGGFGFYLRVARDSNQAYRCQIDGRTCWLIVEGYFKVWGKLKVEKDFYCNIVVAVDPTDEKTHDGYAYHCYYSPKTLDDYMYTSDARKIISAILFKMGGIWQNEDDVQLNEYINGNGKGFDFLAEFRTYRDLGMYNSRLR